MSYEGDILLQINEETGLFDIGYDSDFYVDIANDLKGWGY